MKKTLRILTTSVVLVMIFLSLTACSSTNTSEMKKREYVLHYYFELVENETSFHDWNFIVSQDGKNIESGTVFSFSDEKDESIELSVTIKSVPETIKKSETIIVPFYGGAKKHSTKIIPRFGTSGRQAVWNFVYWYEEV